MTDCDVTNVSVDDTQNMSYHWDVTRPGPECTRPGTISPSIYCVIINHILSFYKTIIQQSKKYIEKLV